MKRLRRWLIASTLAVLGFAAFIAVCQWLVAGAAKGRLYNRVEEVPASQTAVLLGCVKNLAPHLPNPFFTSRIEAAATLYKAGKLKAIIASGDNHRQGYDEPTDMKEALVAAGVPENIITCDYAGFRTLDSVVRAKKVFGQTKVLFISQRFHNERALYLASHTGLEATAFNARDIPLAFAPSTYLREVFARVKAVLDAQLMHTAPKLLGPPVDIAPLQ